MLRCRNSGTFRAAFSLPGVSLPRGRGKSSPRGCFFSLSFWSLPLRLAPAVPSVSPCLAGRAHCAWAALPQAGLPSHVSTVTPGLY